MPITWINRPFAEDADTLKSLARISAIFETVSDEAALALFDKDLSWREFNAALIAAVMSPSPATFVLPLIDSLSKSPKGLSVVPAFAALVVLVGPNPDPAGEVLKQINQLDRNKFDGELGWALDKFLFHVGVSANNPAGMSPNDGKSFEDNLAMFRKVRELQTRNVSR